MKVLYATVTRNCNLSCPHCDIKRDTSDNYNETLFLENVQKDYDHKVIFGGEPSLHIDRIQKIAPYCDSISTNLLFLDKDLINIYNSLSVATSWNPLRFTDSQYNQWIDNIKRLKNKPSLLITLTLDLLVYKDLRRLLQEEFDGLFEDIVFEQLLDPNKSQAYYEEVDRWLCDLYDFWKHNMKTPSSTFTRSSWYYDCSDTWTMEPNGKIHYGCPQYTVTTGVISECYSCAKVNECRPCMLQTKCTRPSQLMEKIYETETK